MDNKKSSKKRRIVFKIIIFALSSIFSLVFLLGMLLFDPYVYQQDYRSLSKEEIYEEAVVLSTYSVESTKKISYEISPSQLNELFKLSFDKIKDNYQGHVTSFYVIENSVGYDFIFEGNLIPNSVFRTRLNVHTVLSKGDDGFIFDIKNMNTGKINQINFVKGRKILTDELLEQLFKDASLSIKSDLKNNRFTYSFEDVFNDFYFHIDFTDGFFKATFDELMLNKEVAMPFMVKSDISSFTTNETYINPNRIDRLSLNLKDYKSGTAYLIQKDKNNKLVSNDIYKYLLKGYEKLNSIQKSNIDKINFTEFGITTNSEYKGIEIPFNSNDSIEHIVKSEFSNYDVSSISSGNTYHISSVSEVSLTKMLRTSDSLFRGNTLSCNSYVSTFTISDVYTELINNHLYFIYEIDIDGLKTYITLDFLKGLSSGYKLNFDLLNIYYGESTASDSLKEKVLKLVNESLTTTKSNGFMTFGDNKLELDFSNFVSESSNGVFFNTFGNGSVDLSNSSLSQEGRINISFTAI